MNHDRLLNAHKAGRAYAATPHATETGARVIAAGLNSEESAFFFAGFFREQKRRAIAARTTSGMYHVYCEASGAEIVTPDYNHARRAFFQTIRDNPAEIVTCDKIENLGASDTADDIINGTFDGRRVRVMHCDPQH